MTQEINDGGQAFPQKEPTTSDCQGLTVRDYFAAKAMQGWIASAPDIKGVVMNWTRDHADGVAEAAYVMADAMLKAREMK